MKTKTSNTSSEVLKNRIIKISRRLFLGQGYENTTVRQIQQRSGLSTGSLYHFFKNREELLLFALHDALFAISSLTDSIAAEYEEPLLRYALDIALGTSEVLKHKLIEAKAFAMNLAERLKP